MLFSFSFLVKNLFSIQGGPFIRQKMRKKEQNQEKKGEG
jgi:hypothetical protein